MYLLFALAACGAAPEPPVDPRPPRASVETGLKDVVRPSPNPVDQRKRDRFGDLVRSDATRDCTDGSACAVFHPNPPCGVPNAVRSDRLGSLIAAHDALPVSRIRPTCPLQNSEHRAVCVEGRCELEAVPRGPAKPVLTIVTDDEGIKVEIQCGVGMRERKRLVPGVATELGGIPPGPCSVVARGPGSDQRHELAPVHGGQTVRCSATPSGATCI